MYHLTLLTTMYESTNCFISLLTSDVIHLTILALVIVMKWYFVVVFNFHFPGGWRKLCVSHVVFSICISLLWIACSYRLSDFYCVVCLFFFIDLRSWCMLAVNSLCVQCATYNGFWFAACKSTLHLRRHFSVQCFKFWCD